jgi:hypothetical protein
MNGKKPIPEGITQPIHTCELYHANQDALFGCGFWNSLGGSSRGIEVAGTF